MLGVVTNPTMTPSDVVMKQVADEMGVGETFRLTPVGVYFGTPGAARGDDPYFGGAGPDRTGCIECGECMTGCRHDAKNTLPKNYLLPGRGRPVRRCIPLTTVTEVRPLPGGGYRVATRPTDGARPRAAPARRQDRLTAEQVVFAASALGHPAAAARACATAAVLPQPVGAARLSDPDELRVDPRRHRPRRRTSTSAGASRSRRRSTPTSTPTSSRCATARAATR